MGSYASDNRRLAIGIILDGTLAVLASHRRSRSDPLPTFSARLNAMARLSHKVAAAIDISALRSEPVPSIPVALRNMGSFEMLFYTPEQQARLGVNEKGDKAS